MEDLEPRVEWVKAVQRTGFTDALKTARQRISALEYLTPQEVEELFRIQNTKNKTAARTATLKFLLKSN